MKDYASAISRGILKATAVIAGVVLLLWLFFKISPLLLAIGIAYALALTGRPLRIFLHKKLRFTNTFAALTTLLFIFATIVFLTTVFIPVFVEQGRHFSKIDFGQVKQDLYELNIQASDYLGINHLQVVEAIKQSNFVKNFFADVLPGFFNTIFGSFGSFIVGLFSVLFISFFFMKDESLIAQTVVDLAKRGNEEKFKRILKKTNELLSRYFIGLLIQILILFLFYSVLTLYLDLNNAIAIALLCSFLNIVPYLGPLTGWIFMLLMIVSDNLDADFSSGLLPLLVIGSIGYGVAQLFDNLITQPIVFGRSVRSHPLEIFMIILIGGYVFGIAGMILAVPVYTTVKVSAKEFFSEYKIVDRLTRNM